MKKLINTVLALCTAGFISSAANAAVIHSFDDNLDGSLNGQVALIPGVTVSPVGFIDSWLFTEADIPSPQSPANIETVLEGFAPGGFGNLSLVSFGDISGQNATFNVGGGGANVFAIHLGKAEMVFVYDFIVTSFVINIPSGPTYGGLSNVRTFLDPSKLANSNPDVPLPAAAWLLLSGIGGLGAMKRLRKGK